MRAAGKLLRWLGAILGLLIVLVLAGFAMLQTQAGQAWLAKTAARMLSDPDFTVAIEGASGFVPFRLKVDRIEIGDRDGVYLTARDFALNLAVGELLAGRLHIRSLSFAEIDMLRQSTAPPSTTPLTDYFKVPHLPVGVVLDRMSIARLALAPPVLGEPVLATVEGNARLAGEMAEIALDLHRIDGSAGNIALAMELTGATPTLNLQLTASEPTGVLLDRMLGRGDRAPLALSVSGTGPLADWHGRVAASAGALARVEAEVGLAVTSRTVLDVSGTAEMTPLLPADLAPLVGERIRLSLHASRDDRTVVDPLAVEIAAGRLTGAGSWGGSDNTVTGHLQAEMPALAPLAGLLATQLSGSASLTAAISGTESRPALELAISGSNLRVGGAGADRVVAKIAAKPTGALDNPAVPIELAGAGRIEGILAPAGMVLPPGLGRDIDWSLAATAARDGSTVELTRLAATGPGLALTGSGQLTGGGQGIEGRVRLAVADLRPFSGLVGQEIAGSAEFAADAVREGQAGFKASLHGSATGLQTGIAAGDALLGDSVTVSGSLARGPAGELTLDRLAIIGASINLSGDARFDPASNRIAAALALELPRLKPLGAALGSEVAGALSAYVNAEGPLDHLRIKAEVAGDDLAADGAEIDRLRLNGAVADIAEPKATLDGTFRAYGLDGSLALAAEANGSEELVLPHFRLSAADSAVQGSLRVALDTGLVRGTVNGEVPDLGRWSKLAGMPLGGKLEFNAGLEARGGQSLDLSLSGARLNAGSASSQIAIGRVQVSGRFADILGAPSGTGKLSLTAARFGSGLDISTANLSLDAPRPGRFAFQGDVKGKPLTLAFGGEAGLEPGRIELRLARLSGALGRDRLLLEQPLTASKRGSDLAFSNLALDFGTGRITGNGAVRGEALSLALDVANFSIASGGRLVGYPNARGTLTAAATLGGTLRAPQGRFSVNARDLTMTASKRSQVPSLGLGIDGTWNGRSLDLRGQVTGLKGDTITLAGSAPLVLTPSPLGISVPPQGRLALQLQGNGQLENLADLLPLGEDRVRGRFTADLTVGGTVSAPAASGRLRLSDARYENFATGAVLTKMQAEVVGDRDRFTLNSLTAADSANGTLQAHGAVALQGTAGPTADLVATLTNFRLAARDEVVATATGKVSIAGPLSAPKVTAPLTIDRADITLPQGLPPKVVVLEVIETGGKRGQKPTPAANQQPALPVPLDITIDMPGNIFVRGHGLESEWRGKLAITGTSAAPAINGALEEIHGSVDLLGKSFNLTQGTITFDGTGKLDPSLDIVAEVNAAEITARVNIGGFASAPTVTLSSIPVVPQDEILSRVLFNRGVSQMTAGEGLQLAAAASALAGGGPGALDRLRSGLGFDWFRVGSSSSGPTTGTLNPRAATGGAASGTALSAGKYIAPGVSVGVSQGVSPPTSKVTVEIEVRPHLTVGGEAGQSGSTGLGLNWTYDY